MGMTKPDIQSSTTMCHCYR